MTRVHKESRTIGMAIDEILARLDQLADDAMRWAACCHVFDVLCARRCNKERRK